MNRPAYLFRTLAHAFNRDAADPAVDALAAELASCVATSRAPLLLGLLRKEAIPRYYNLVFVLDGYGLILRQRYREDGRGAWLWLEPKGDAVSEFEGAAVRARRVPAPRPELAAAAADPVVPLDTDDLPALPGFAPELPRPPHHPPLRRIPALPEAA